MLLRLLGIKRKSRRQRLAERARDIVPDVPDVDLGSVRRKLPRRDTGGDSVALSLIGGVLLGLLIGVVVALVLSSQRDEASSLTRRPTQIKLLPHRESHEASGKTGDETQAAHGQ